MLHIKQVALSTANLDTSLQFWKDILGMKVLSKDDKQALLTYEEAKQASLRLVSTPNGEAVDHATAFGRIAFALPTPDLSPLEQKVKNSQLGTVKTPLVVLPTPGKADVQVIILEDPVSSPLPPIRTTSKLKLVPFFLKDKNEICFVGEEGFSDLSVVDPNAVKLLQEAMEADKSNEWYEKKKKF